MCASMGVISIGCIILKSLLRKYIFMQSIRESNALKLEFMKTSVNVYCNSDCKSLRFIEKERIDCAHIGTNDKSNQHHVYLLA